MKRCVKIAGTGMYHPEQKMTMEEISAELGGIDLSGIVEKTGIGCKYLCPKDQGSAFLATEAAKQALENAHISAEDLDMIIVSTDTPEYISPATAHVVHNNLGAKNAAAFDMNCACAGFVHACEIGSKFISSDKQYNNILAIGTYAMTHYLDWKDAFTVPIFSDGAGAAVLQSFEGEGGYLSGRLIADGHYHDYMGIYCGGSKNPCNAASMDKNEHCVKFVKAFPASLNTEQWPIIIDDALKMANLSVPDIDFIIFTQINRSAIQIMMDKLHMPMDKTICIMGDYGYTGSACIPMALHVALQQGKIKPGDHVVLCASGGGYSMGSIVFKWA